MTLYAKKTIIKKIIINLCIIMYGLMGINESQEIQKRFTQDNLIIVNGRRFFPIGIFGADSDSSTNICTLFPELKVTGFNCVQTYIAEKSYIVEYCDWAQRFGLLVLVSPGARVPAFPEKKQEVVSFIKELGQHPAILSWYIADEPDETNNSPEKVRELLDFVNDLGSTLPGAITVAEPNNYADFAPSADIFMFDSYPVPRGKLITVSEEVKLAREAVADNKPVWAIIQAFGSQDGYSHKTWPREPTYKEMRVMTYLAIASGAKGIFYYTYLMSISDVNNRYFIKRTPGHWDSLIKIVNELNTIYPLLISPEVDSVSLREVDNDMANQSLFYTTRQVEHEDSDIKKGTYVIAVNGSDQSLAVSLETQNLNSIRPREYFTNRCLYGGNGLYEDFIDGFGINIYWIGDDWQSIDEDSQGYDRR